jgi:hypothetical protein
MCHQIILCDAVVGARIRRNFNSLLYSCGSLFDAQMTRKRLFPPLAWYTGTEHNQGLTQLRFPSVAKTRFSEAVQKTAVPSWNNRMTPVNRESAMFTAIRTNAKITADERNIFHVQDPGEIITATIPSSEISA